jgi:trans-2,3-dihydro-3-hydroxyanthranilate isomerase
VAPSAADVAAGADYRLRIFTPTTEIPFAGHPSVGAAWVMARLGRVGTGVVRQACGAGVLPLSVSEGPGRVELTGGDPYVSEPVDAAPLLAAVGLSGTDLAGPPPRFAGTGLTFGILTVRPDSLGRCAPDLPRLAGLRPPAYEGDVGGLAVVAWDETPTSVRARVFPAGVGVLEDPATGSAALALGVHLVASGLVGGGLGGGGSGGGGSGGGGSGGGGLGGGGLGGADAETGYTVVQGVEIGRPSTLWCRVTARSGAAVRCHVAGDVVPVARGEIAVPPA